MKLYSLYKTTDLHLKKFFINLYILGQVNFKNVDIKEDLYICIVGMEANYVIIFLSNYEYGLGSFHLINKEKLLPYIEQLEYVHIADYGSWRGCDRATELLKNIQDKPTVIKVMTKEIEELQNKIDYCNRIIDIANEVLDIIK